MIDTMMVIDVSLNNGVRLRSLIDSSKLTLRRMFKGQNGIRLRKKVGFGRLVRDHGGVRILGFECSSMAVELI